MNTKTANFRILQHPHPEIIEAEADTRGVRWKLQIPNGYGFEALEILDGWLLVTYSYLSSPHTLLEHRIRFDARVDKREAVCSLTHHHRGQVVTLRAPLQHSATLSRSA